MAARATAFRAARKHNQRTPNVRLVPMRPQSSQGTSRFSDDKNVSFGRRRSMVDTKGKRKAGSNDHAILPSGDGGMEISWVPSDKTKTSGTWDDEDHDTASGARVGKGKGNDKTARRKGVEMFGAGMEKGGETHDAISAMGESERSGRTFRRKGMRSGSKNTFRRM